MKGIYQALAFLFIFIFYTATAFSQTSGLGTWEIINGRYNVNKQWFGFVEGHLYTQKLVHDINYYELNIGAGYVASKNVTLVFGVGQYETYQPDGDFKSPIVNDEHRIWEQLSLVNFIGRVRIEQRYRLEQVFSSARGYRNRLRYRPGVNIPINHATLKPGTFYASASNEFFITNESPFYDQDWLFVGGGCQITSHLNLQIGWMNRMNQSASAVPTWKNYFHTTLQFVIDHPVSRKK
jgi:hypothetical protein